MIRSHAVVHFVTGFFRSRNHDVHHLVGISGSGAYLDTGLAQCLYGIHHAGYRFGIILQGIKQHALKSHVTGLHVLIGVVATELLAESSLDPVDVEQGTDFLNLGQPHVSTGLRSRHRHADLVETLDESRHGGKATVIHSRTGPI